MDHQSGRMRRRDVEPRRIAGVSRHLAVRHAKGDQGAVEIQTLLGDAAFERVLLSPAKVEKAKLIDKKALADLVTQAEGKPALVPENDKRPAITLASTEFELITSNPDAPWE